MRLDKPSRTSSPRRLGCLIESAETLVLTIVIFWLMQTFVAQPFQVQQESMQPTLTEGEYVLVDKLTPRLAPYARGDIVIFRPHRQRATCEGEFEPLPGDSGIPFIKRVIGEPGDKLVINDGRVFVNGSELRETYVSNGPVAPDGQWDVALDRLFLMGDNRPNSTDSRSSAIGPVCISDVIGRAWLRYWPVSRLSVIQRPTYAE